MQNDSAHTEPDPKTADGVAPKNARAQAALEYGKILFITILASLFLKAFIVDAYRIPSTSMENTLQIGDFLLVNKLAYGVRSPRHIPFTSISIPAFTIPLHKVHRGDVVVFEFPGGRDEVHPSEAVNYIKRCVGLPGDTVEIRAGRVIVNHVELPFPSNGKRPENPASTVMRRNEKIFPAGSKYTDVDYGPVVVPKSGDSIVLDANTIGRWRVLVAREGHAVGLLPDGTISIDGRAARQYCIQDNYYFVLGDNRDNSMDSRFWGFVPDDHLIGEALCIYWSWDSELSVPGFFARLSTIRWKRIGMLIR
jgi:signal peptidase I